MRLDKFLSQQLSLSRTIIGRELRAAKVSVNNEIVKKGAYQLVPEDEVSYDGNLIPQIHGFRYFMLNKPVGYVCSTDDPDYPTITYFIDEPAAHKLHAAGRLDLDTTGLVLLTDDGQWSHRITSPRHHCEKTYLVTVQEILSATLVNDFLKGIMLRNEKTPTKPAKLEILDSYTARLTINEGRYHQVKRMFAAMGNHVTSLHRESIGPIILDNSLEPGEYRPLTEDEIDWVYKNK